MTIIAQKPEGDTFILNESPDGKTVSALSEEGYSVGQATALSELPTGNSVDLLPENSDLSCMATPYTHENNIVEPF